MFASKWVPNDGYHESLISLREGLGPILKARAVMDSAGLYYCVVRDFKTGLMLASNFRDFAALPQIESGTSDITEFFCTRGGESLGKVKQLAIRLAMLVLKESTFDVSEES
jgi:hypothetical protein